MLTLLSFYDELELITPKLDFSESNKRKVIDKRVKFLVDGEITDKDTFFAIASMGQHGLLLPSFVRTYEEAENLKIALNNIYEPKGIKFHIFKHESENG